MIAFVLSGGGSRGGLQAGALLALLERGIKPDLIVGTSVGSINGAALAASSSAEGARCIAERWRTVTRADIFPGNPAQVAWRLLSQQPSLYPNYALYRFILSLLPAGVRRFKDLQTPLLVTATNLCTGTLHLFGDDPDERLIDALMASSAIPPYLPPWRYRDELYVDGGVVANLPLSIALQRGATTIYALEIGHEVSSLHRLPSLRHTVSYSIRGMLQQQVQRECEMAGLICRENIELHHIRLVHYSGLPHEDFSHGAALLELGYTTMCAYLAGEELPATVPAPRRTRSYEMLKGRLRYIARRHPAALRRPSFGRRLRMPRPAVRRPSLGSVLRMPKTRP